MRIYFSDSHTLKSSHSQILRFMSHFLAPLLAQDPDRFTLHHARTSRPLATDIEIAFDGRSRRRGLLGRENLRSGAALILAPCSSIHTWFMRFPIDVLFVGRDGVVLRI